VSVSQDQRYLAYIKRSIELIQQRVHSKSYEMFMEDVDTQDAVLWRLETLGEATGRLSDEVMSRHPQIRWRAIYGFRNIAAHGYIDLNLDLVWEIINLHLGDLKNVVEQELARNDSPDTPESR
jgi:uncharacterized protein with HEPN domain